MDAVEKRTESKPPPTEREKWDADNAGLITKPKIAENLKAFLANRKPGSGPVLPAAEIFSGNSLAERVSALKKNPKAGSFRIMKVIP